jgi:hypothetical protein
MRLEELTLRSMSHKYDDGANEHGGAGEDSDVGHVLCKIERWKGQLQARDSDSRRTCLEITEVGEEPHDDTQSNSPDEGALTTSGKENQPTAIAELQK